MKAKYIFEYDFSGFFNTVRIEAVGDTLHRLYVPKVIVAYICNISSGEIKNISRWQLLKNLKTKDPTKQGFSEAWKKYEFIHKYRYGYRSCGLPQGFALSPLLSVISLIVLDELEMKGVKYVMYADDGIFYSNKDIDFL
ncbi:MAG TPA: reverse transcriptase domain-containing protein [Methylomirabilota bacterium]|nr:reverse transcriptase domain-containing protein [Methylomirabilota bacterium]